MTSLKQKRAQTMANLTDKSRDFEKFTKELHLALEKELIRQQRVAPEDRRTKLPLPPTEPQQDD